MKDRSNVRMALSIAAAAAGHRCNATGRGVVRSRELFPRDSF